MQESEQDIWIKTPQLLDETAVKHFVDEGYLIMEGLVSPDEVEEMRKDTIDIARGEYPCKEITSASDNVSDEEVLASILFIHQPYYISPVMLRFVQHAKICGILSQITAAHLPFWDGSVKCMQSIQQAAYYRLSSLPGML